MKQFTTHISRITTALAVFLGTSTAHASQYWGDGLSGGADEAGTIVGDNNVRETVILIVKKVLTYMALAAVVVIVIAGIIMVVSGGNEESKERAKRMILYTIIGLVIILIARGLVTIFTSL